MWMSWDKLSPAYRGFFVAQTVNNLPAMQET